MTPWEIKAREFGNCNCSYGCPCQFNALPTHGNCEAVVGFEIDEGHYGEVNLDGTRFAYIAWWPGPVHEGQGKCQMIMDTSTSEAQREALLKISMGEDTEPGTTIFSVFASTYDEIFDPIIAEIDFEANIEARKGRIIVDGLIETRGEPIRNPVTGHEHRARIDIPDGFEYSIAEIGSASTVTQGNIQLNLKDTYGQFCHIHMNNQGVIHD